MPKRMGIEDGSVQVTVEDEKKNTNKYETWTISQILDYTADGSKQVPILNPSHLYITL